MSDFYWGGETESGVARKFAYGNRVDAGDSGIEEFDGGSMPAGWSWASYTGYVTPSVSHKDSTISVTFSSDARAFLYRTDGTLSNAQSFLAGIISNNTGYMVGLRLDDGTNNNYVEVALRYKALGKYNLIDRYRTGGGTEFENTRCELDGGYLGIPMLSPYGTFWSNWIAQIQLLSHNGVGAVVVDNFKTGSSWTPSRRGFVFEGINSSWQTLNVDWYRGG